MTFQEQLEAAQRRLKKVQGALDLTLLLEKRERYDSAYDQAFDFAYEAEQLTLLARVMPAYTGHPRFKERMEAQVADAIPITVELTPEGWLKVVIPALLPRKERGNTNYIFQNLYPAMKRFTQDRPPFHFPKSVIVFQHVYNYQRPERWLRDHDNIELNEVVDAVVFYLLPDDSPKYLEHYYCAGRGEADVTEVYLVPQDDFDRFRVALKSGRFGASPI